jgi:hypothetical protein
MAGSPNREGLGGFRHIMNAHDLHPSIRSRQCQRQAAGQALFDRNLTRQLGNQ